MLHRGIRFRFPVGARLRHGSSGATWARKWLVLIPKNAAAALAERYAGDTLEKFFIQISFAVSVGGTWLDLGGSRLAPVARAADDGDTRVTRGRHLPHMTIYTSCNKSQAIGIRPR